MATETANGTVQSTTGAGSWQAGLVGGLVGGLVMGIMLTTQMTPVIEKAIPAMYGFSGGLAGWVIHMSHSAVLGVVFAAIAGVLSDTVDSPGKLAGLGVGYGIVLWVVLAVVVMPIWLKTAGFPPAVQGAVAVPNISPKSLVGHVVYGFFLGLAYPFVEDAL